MRLNHIVTHPFSFLNFAILFVLITSSLTMLSSSSSSDFSDLGSSTFLSVPRLAKKGSLLSFKQLLLPFIVKIRRLIHAIYLDRTRARNKTVRVHDKKRT